ncbi:MAG: ribonuclease P protein component [Desulfocapsaceae bacterium]
MHRFALPKHCFLRKNWEFDYVYKHGRRLHGQGFSIVFVATDRSYNRIGISISRKLKGAVARNRIKRIFRESFRLNRECYPGNADIVIAVRPDFSLNSPVLITQAVTDLMSSYSMHP